MLSFVEQIAGAFAGHAQALFARDLGNPLTLLAVRLEILLERDDAVRRQPGDFVLCDFVAGELVEIGTASIQ